MGELINLKCRKCGYETNLGIGAGILFNRVENILELFDRETGEKIKALTAVGGILWSVTKEVGVCEKCGKITAIAVFKATDRSGKVTELRSRCTCGSSSIEIYDYEPLQGGKRESTGPACGGEIGGTSQGHWD